MLNKTAKSLKEITSKIGSGATPRGGNSNYKESGISLIRSQNVLDFKFSYDGLAFIDETQAKALNNVNVFENDILLNITGDSIARVCLVPNDVLPARVNQHVSIIRCKNKEDAEYVLCYLQFLKKHLLSICKVGGTRNALTKEAVEKINITLQPNHRILGKFISKINAKIELNNKINRELEAMAKTLYDYWFVQFDFPFDFPATSSGRDAQGKPDAFPKADAPSEVEVKPYKSSGGKMVYNAELKREIPEGWEVKSIDKFIDVKDGTHDSPKPTSSGYHLITSKNLLESGLDFESANLISEKDYININKRSQVERGDILFSMIGSIGVLYKVEESTINFAIKNVALYKSSQSSKYRNYLLQYLKSYDMKRYMGNVISGSIQKFIGLGSLRKMPFLFNSGIIDEFNNRTKEIYQKLDNNKRQNQHLTALRDWLLPMLMNGQVVSTGSTTVKDAALRQVQDEKSSSTELSRSMAAEPLADYNRK